MQAFFSRRISLLFVLCLSYFISDAQLNMDLIGHLDYSQNTSDIWGYVDDDGTEYALLGLENGVSIVSLADPTDPEQIHFIPGPSTIWRDLKFWDDYAYVTNESGGGLLVVDLTGLPGSVDSYNFTAGSYDLDNAHNVFIDENGYAYVCGSNIGVGGVLMLDLNPDPWIPQVAGLYDDEYVHDLFVRGDTMWTGEIYAGQFGVIDVSDKSDPEVLATQTTPDFFCHNTWLSDDGATLFTTDEVQDAVVAAYDVSDLDDIQFLDSYQSAPGSQAIPHNTFVKGKYVITSYYTEGVSIVDASNPSSLVEVGKYDTSPSSGGSFDGCWGVYPYLPSGYLIASDQQQGLFVLEFNNAEAAFLEGLVSNSVTSSPLNGVNVEIVGSGASSTSTGFDGMYSTGLANAGTFSVVFSKTGFEALTVDDVVLIGGETTVLNVEMVEIEPFVITGQVVDSINGEGISNAHVLIDGDFESAELETDVSGFFEVSLFTPGDYNIYAGTWSYVTKLSSDMTLGEGTDPLLIELAEGYYDDFLFDFNWLITGNAETGEWEIADPEGTYSGFGSPVNPENDVNGDFGITCYVTGGQAGGSVGSFDIDNGKTTLLSPVFDLTNYETASISYERWFYNGGSNPNPNDSLIIKITNGLVTVFVDAVVNDDPGESEWDNHTFNPADYVSLTDNMRIIFEANDGEPGHLVEAGIDQFQVTGTLREPDPPATGITELYGNTTLNVYPNPFSVQGSVSWQMDQSPETVFLNVYDVSGQLIQSTEIHEKSGSLELTSLNTAGFYLATLSVNGENVKTISLIKSE